MLDSHSFLSVIYAFLGGILPTLIWLFFWNREDNKKPEPTKMILIAFLGGVGAVFVSLYIEKIFFSIDPKILFPTNFWGGFLDWIKKLAIIKEISINKFLLVIVFAPIIEEVTKFVFTYFLALRSKFDDEPIDPIIYMITAALGFSAVENALFLIDPITKSDVIFGVVTGNLRFIGATLLHTLSSATVGIFIGYHVFSKKITRDFFSFIGIVFAIIIHAIFNYLMIGEANVSFIALEFIWMGVIILLLIFERIKKKRIEKIEEIN